tara:strand:+ start:102 stop:290 length:189 start_codon:yes stop_codon:yes gene_type:complete
MRDSIDARITEEVHDGTDTHGRNGMLSEDLLRSIKPAQFSVMSNLRPTQRIRVMHCDQIRRT